jgi:hypothetical protein
MTETDNTVTDIVVASKSYTPRLVVTTLMERLKDRMNNNIHRERLRRQLNLKMPASTDVQVILFMEYLVDQVIPAASLPDVYPSVVAQVKEYVAQTSSYKHVFLPVLRYGIRIGWFS